MSVKVRPYRNGGWEVDIQFRLPDGTRHRERYKAPVESKSGALRWGQDRERHLLHHGPERAGAAVEVAPDGQGGQDGEQRADRVERHAEDRSRVGADRPASVFDPAA